MSRYNYLYDSRWRKAREIFIAENPLCARHKAANQVVPATVVDHKVPHRGDITLFWDRDNWQSLCDWCHNAHKQSIEMGGSGRYEINLDGEPIDPDHPWNVSRGT